MELIELKTAKRNSSGKGVARALRRNGMIPAILYGPGTEPLSLSVGTKDLELILKKGRSNKLIITLYVDSDKRERPAMIKEIQRHPVSNTFVHADFYEVDMNRKIKVKVPVITTGKSKGVELGGILQVIRRELAIMCLPTEIPESIVIDITDLDIGDAVHVEDIHLEGNVEMDYDVNITVVTIVAPKAEKTEEEKLEEGEGAAAEEGKAEEGKAEEGKAKEGKPAGKQAKTGE